MSLSTQTNRTDHTENGVTTVFPFDFKIFSEADLVVISVDQNTLTETTLSLGTDYTISGVNAESGSITKTAGTSGDTLVIKRVVDLTQPTVLRNQGDFFPATHERAFDRSIMIDQQQQEEIDRSFKLSLSATAGSVEAPSAEPGYALGWDALGNLTNVPNTGADQTLAWTAADAVVAADAAAATALVRSDLASSDPALGSALITWLCSKTGAVGVTLYAWLNNQTLIPEIFGVVGNGVTNDTANMQKAIDACAGRTLRLLDKQYSLSSMTVTGANTRIQFGPKTEILNLTPSATLFAISADNCTIDGAFTGKITSPGEWDGANTTPTYAIIRSTGNKTRISNLAFSNIKRVGVWFENGNDNVIEGCTLEGNYPTASWTGVETGHFGVLLDFGAGPGNFRATNNTIKTCVQGIFLGNYGTGSGADFGGILISNNNFEGCWNHGVYMTSSFGAVISTNNFLNCQVPVAAVGNYHVVSNNTMTTNGTGALNNIAGISMRDNFGCVVSGNTIVGDGATSSIVINFTNLAGTDISSNIIVDNVVQITGGTSVGIGLGSSALTETCKNNIISRNKVYGTGIISTGIIQLTMKATFYGYGNQVTDNVLTLKGNSNGISLVNQTYGNCSRNVIMFEFDAAGPSTDGGVYSVNTTYTRIESNDVFCSSAWGTNVTLRGIWDNTGCDYNIIQGNRTILNTTKLAGASPIVRVSGTNSIVRDNIATSEAAKLSGTATVALGTASIVVANTNVTTDSLVLIAPSDTGGGKLLAAPGVYVTQTAGTGFSILTADGTNAAQASSFRWTIR